MELKRLGLENVDDLREARVKELKISHVFDFLEQAVNNGTCWGLLLRNDIICYWIYMEKSFGPLYEKSIIEFYIKEGYRYLGGEILQLVAKQFEPRGIYVCTDDTFLLSLLLERGYHFDVADPILLREKKVRITLKENLEFNLISEETFEEAFKILISEEPENAGINEEYYLQIKSEICKDTYWTLIREGIVIGVAYWKKQRYNNYVAIFPIVQRNYRRRGYGSYMISKLADYLERNYGYQPIAYINQFNLGARKAFEKLGFYTVALNILFRISP
ncbi:MAG: GNAT family N-acetyltransferase [Candidatus Jordarchaeaceae archaeon]